MNIMEKKIIVGCFVAGMLIMITSLLFKAQIDPVVYSRIFAIGFGLCMPRYIQNVLRLF